MICQKRSRKKERERRGRRPWCQIQTLKSTPFSLSDIQILPLLHPELRRAHVGRRERGGRGGKDEEEAPFRNLRGRQGGGGLALAHLICLLLLRHQTSMFAKLETPFFHRQGSRKRSLQRIQAIHDHHRYCKESPVFLSRGQNFLPQLQCRCCY